MGTRASRSASVSGASPSRARYESASPPAADTAAARARRITTEDVGSSLAASAIAWRARFMIWRARAWSARPLLRMLAVMQILQGRVTLARIGVAARVLRAGTGAPVVLLHGNPDNANEWRPVLRELAGAGRALAPDLPGFGAGDEPPASFDYSRAAFERFFDELLVASGI